MSDADRSFTMAIVGFSARELRILQQIFRLSQVRPRRYAAWQHGSVAPDLILVDGDALGEPQQIERQLSTAGAVEEVPTLWVTTAELAGVPGRVIPFQRPMIVTRLLQAMDRVVTERYGYRPELVIQDDANSAEASRLRWTPPCVSSPGAQPLCSGKPILVVDDSEAVRRLMEVNLAPCAFTVDFAASGEEALERIAQRHYALIFLDVVLPGIQGLELCRKLKKELHITTPIVLLTGRTSRLDRLRGTLASADHYLTKPLSHQDLLACLHAYFPLE